jgi:hypothetical protein
MGNLNSKSVLNLPPNSFLAFQLNHVAARAPLQESQAGLNDSAAQTQHLSLYITSLLLDFARAEYELSASMMAAIKCLDDRLGERGARSEWVWEFWQNDWTFRQESEVWGEEILSHLMHH